MEYFSWQHAGKTVAWVTMAGRLLAAFGLGLLVTRIYRWTHRREATPNDSFLTTSGAICRQLELGAFRGGGNIDPGVPLCYSLGKFKLPVALKSGNFGAPDFYQKAAKDISRWKEYLQ
jgi:hypothetical protein